VSDNLYLTEITYNDSNVLINVTDNNDARWKPEIKLNGCLAVA